MAAFNLPTPIDRIKFRGIALAVKRDDLIHPVVCGNKWRKLKGWVTRLHHAQHVVSFGGGYSNHLPALARLLQQSGTPGTFIIRGEELSPQSSASLRYSHALGMKFEFVSRATYAELRKAGWDLGLLPDLNLGHPETLVIPEGGFGKEVLKGCAEIWTELAPEVYDHFVLPCGSGATALGIIEAMPQNSPMRLHVVSAVKGAKREERTIREAAVAKGIQCVFMDDIHGGFGKSPERLERMAMEFTASTGIPLNRNYTPKAIDYIVRSQLSGSILLLHTGGFNLSGDFE